jgi:glucose/arabinose dehydrogenase|tara:strand:- start:917 stop:2257 length:1341 start_codon:yes stop_codon:yes gene_type:complete
MKKLINYLALIFICYNSSFSQSVLLESFGPSFNSPVEIKNAGDERLFVVEKSGKIKILNQNGSVNSTPFLDIEDRVSTNANERGLLGLAFHPNYPENPFFFVNYTNNSGATTISKFSVSANQDIANDSETILLEINQPYANHNGGCINFGPDGNLYIGMGDGGSGGDPQNYSQNTESLLGKMLRINVNSGAYSIPENNPYGDEIWSIGLRNPWKFSFDSLNGDLWIADVGQNEFEEINMVQNNPANINYGWRCYEGNEPYNLSGCPDEGLTFPVSTYSHYSSGDFKCSITGGYVYRGNQISGLNGVYFFADYCSGEIGLLSKNENDEWDMSLAFPNINGSWVSFGEDINGELYIASINGGIYKIIDAALSNNEIDSNTLNYFPNPFQDYIQINSDRPINIELYDLSGRKLREFKNYNQEILDLGFLNKGTYIIKVDGYLVKKLIKN